jgi:hypothetical protein
MRKIVLTFGLISGAIISLMMVATVPFSEQIGFDRGAVIGYTSMVLAFLLVYFGVRSYRDNVAGGSVRFGRAFMVGALIVGVATVCYVATWQVVYRNFVPDFAERYTEYTIEKERRAGATEAELAEQRAEMEKFAEMYENPLVSIAFTFLEPLPVGLVIALVSAGVLSRRRKEDHVVDGDPALAG